MFTTWVVIVLTAAIGLIIIYIISTKRTTKRMLKTKYGVNSLMRLHTKIQCRLPPKLALITDLDHTLIGQQSNQTHKECNNDIQRFNDLWCKQYAPRNSILIYATGRNFEKYQLAVDEWDLLKPDILISQDGVNIHWFNKSLAQQVQARSTHRLDISFDDGVDTEQFLWHDQSWQSILEHGWNQELAQQIHEELNQKFDLLPLPPGSYSIEQFRIGILCKGYDLAYNVQKYVTQRVEQYNEDNKGKDGFVAMEIHSFIGAERYQENAYWSAVTPGKAGKGCAVEFLKQRLGLDNDRIVCAGDSGNDISMMECKSNNVVVANASHELLDYYEKNSEHDTIFRTVKPTTLGVIEGLQYYGTSILNK